MELMLFEVSTQRLLLKPISMAYKTEIFREFTREVSTYLYSEPAEKIQYTEKFINQSLLKIEKGEELIIVILKKDSQEFLGCTGIHQIHSKYPQFGIWLKKSAHKSGYATETITALKSWADQNLNYEYIQYSVDEANTPSRRVAEKLGGKIARKYDHITLSAKVLNIVEYRIIKHQNSDF
ncbi:GNAT family N-acetyltransferase [Anabaena sp. UHCC 0204]|uniref:GNAT family N-acetyltransferase n=1 Tax=Anabaena sp. UHCC 0204 TaxID=2590009 RepID=UPI0014478768|nr:GNAT family N-acetyltransferase [Anabaena sp. UHCC 0204]MTJ08887.1 GNAT family N-acetyltransferase [Anabaena sp. UHCC 0204]